MLRTRVYHQKAHSIPYDAVNTWNSVVNPSKYAEPEGISDYKTNIFTFTLQILGKLLQIRGEF